jgi:hypothetical protein
VANVGENKTLIDGDVHYRNRRLCRVPEALGKALKTLGKIFAECHTRQRGLDIQCISKAVFVEYFFRALGKVVCRVPESTRQRKAAVTTTGDGGGVFAECPGRHSAKEFTLPSVCLTALGKESAREVPLSGTLPSVWYCTRQSVVLCRVSEPLHSAKNLYWCPGLGSLPSAMPLTLGKAPLCRVSHSAE